MATAGRRVGILRLGELGIREFVGLLGELHAELLGHLPQGLATFLLRPPGENQHNHNQRHEGHWNYDCEDVVDFHRSRPQ